MWDWMRRNLGFPSNEPRNIPAEPLREYPTKADALDARQGGYGYGDPQSSFIEKGVPKFLGTNQGAMAPLGTDAAIQKMPQTRVPPEAYGTINELRDDFTRAHLAGNYSPVMALGLEGRSTAADVSGTRKNVEGMYFPDTKSMWYSNTVMPSTLGHEATHRGLHLLAEDPRLPPAIKKRIVDHQANESLVRQLMRERAGDPEKGYVPPVELQRSISNRLPDKDLAVVDALVAKIMQERRPRGPR